MKEINWKKNLGIITASQFMAMAGFGCCMPFIPLLLKDSLQINDDHLRGLYMSLYYMTGMISLTVAYPIWGALSDRFGRKIMLLRASYVAGLLYPLLAFAGNFWIMLALRFGTALFSGTVNPAQTLLVTTLPKEKHGLALGLMSTATWSGEMAGYLFGGIMVDHFGYTVAFLTCGAIYLASGVMVHIFVDENFTPVIAPPEAKQRKNFSDKYFFWKLASPAACWVCTLFLFMGISRRIDIPFVAMLVELINGKEKAATYTGFASAFAALGGVFSGFVIGHLCNKYPPRKLLLPILMLSGLFMLGQACSNSIIMLIICRFLTFFAAGALQPVLQLMLTKVTPPEKHGTYFGLTASLNSGGGIICNLISGPVAYYIQVRGVFAVGSLIFFIMIPLLIPTIRAYMKEKIS